MKITKDQLRSWRACSLGYDWFMRHFRSGEGEYQDVLNALVEEDLPGYAEWLIGNAGPDDQAVIKVDRLDCEKFFVAGRLVIMKWATVEILCVGGNIQAGEDIQARNIKVVTGGIKAGGDIWTRWGIEAGKDIEAGGDIEAVRGIIQAGGDIKARGNVKAGVSVKAGMGIKAGGGIKQGKGFGVFAGLDMEIDDWPSQARVIAKVKPDNLFSGHWAGSEGEI